MRKERLILGIGIVLVAITLYVRAVRIIHVHTFRIESTGKGVWRMVNYSSVKAIDAPTFTRINGVEFKNGTLVIRSLNWPRSNKGQHSGGFGGVVFRINGSNSRFEVFYVRPANSRDQAPVRRNDTVQYFSFPAYKLSTNKDSFIDP